MGRTVEGARSSLRWTGGRPTATGDGTEAAETIVEVVDRVRELVRR
jgi:cysteine sulfinate desulfinase/cysteine desulfurase-like protein